MTQNTNPMNQCGLMKTKIKMKTSWWELEPYTLNKPSKQFTSPIFPQATLQPLTRNTFILLINSSNYDKHSYTIYINITRYDLIFHIPYLTTLVFQPLMNSTDQQKPYMKIQFHYLSLLHNDTLIYSFS